MNEPIHTNNNKLPADRTAVSLDTSHKRKESEMTDKTLLTVADLWDGLLKHLERDTGVVVNFPRNEFKDINDGFLADIKDVHYDEQTNTVIIEPNYETIPDFDVNVPKTTASQLVDFNKILSDRVNLLEEALMEIAAIEHQGDECPEWYQDHTVQDMHEDDPDYVKMLAWDETEWYWAWREDNEDQEQLEAAVNIARNVLKKSVDLEDSTMFEWKTNSGICVSTDSNDLPLYTDFDFKNMHDDYVGSVAWFGGYWFYFTTNNSSIIEDTYMTFSEWDDAVAWVNYQGKCATHFELGERADVHHIRSMPEIPLAKNTGEPLGGKNNTDLATNLNLPN